MRVRDENKEAVIRKKAIETISKVGFEGLSMHKLAKEARVSNNTIYIYFKNKEDLLIQIYDEVNQQVTSATLKGFDPEMSLEDGVKKLWLNRYNYFTRHPEHMMLMEHFNNSDLIDKVDKKNYTLFRTTMTKFLDNAKKNNQLIKMPVETYWAITFAPLFQLLKYYHRNRTVENKPFKLTEKDVLEACSHVLKAIST